MGRRGAYGQPSGDRRAQARPESWIERNPVTFLALGLALLFLTGTPQVRLILFDLPPLGSLGLDAEGRRAVALWVYFFVLLGGYVLVAATLVDPRSIEEQVVGPISSHGLRGSIVRVSRRVRELVLPVTEWLLLRPATRRKPGTRRMLGVLLLALGVPFALPAPWHVELPTLLILDRAAQALAGSVACGVGLWLIFARLREDPGRPTMPRERALWDHTVRLGELVGRSLELLILSSLLGEGIWALLEGTDIAMGTGWRAYTLWGSFHLAVLIIVFGRIADAAGRKTWSRIAVGALMALLNYALGATLLPIGFLAEGAPTEGPGDRQAADLDRAEVLTDAWFDRVEHRLDRLPDDEPVLIVAASGGGARAAIWTTYVLEALERTPLELDTMGGTPPVDPIGGRASLADRVLFVSSVSGGSVGSVHWTLGEAHDGPEGDEGVLRNTLLSQLETAYHEEKKAICDMDEWNRSARCRPGSPDLFSPPQWPVNSGRVDEMSTDFNAPALRGIVMPGVERGESVSFFWEDHFGWERSLPLDDPGDRPILLVNATEVQTGLRLVAGIPALPPGLLWDAGQPEVQRADPGWTEGQFRAAVYWSGLEDPDGRAARAVTDVHPWLTVPPQEQVRISANFPWGFDLPRLNLRVELPPGRAAEEPVLVIDGGTLDNTGIDSFAALIDRLEHLALLPEDANAAPRLGPRAAELLDRLALRGVVLLEIDSGARPDQPGLAQRLFDTLTMPLHALSEAGFVRQSTGTALQVDRMRAVLGHRAAQGTAERILEAYRTPPADAEPEGAEAEDAEPEDAEAEDAEWEPPGADESPEPPDDPEEAAAAEAGDDPDPSDPTLAGGGARGSAGDRRAMAEDLAMEEVVGDLVGPRLAHVRYTANHRDNIMTGWALSPEQRGVLLLRFLMEDDQQRGRLLRGWVDLRGENRMLAVLEARARAATAEDREGLVAALRLVGELSIAAEDLAARQDHDRRLELARREAAWRSGLEMEFEPEREPLAPPGTEGTLFVGYWGEAPGTDGSTSVWLTQSVELDDRLAPDDLVGTIRTTLGRRLLYDDVPSPDGSLAGVGSLELAAGTELKLISVASWRGTGLQFARVEVVSSPEGGAPSRD